ncbi:fibrillarin-like rRNA/tRNA 2'-O-methyltransferase [uncultured Methanobrevibacter sp.]|uniref:fibrillarin-like rRNA/tRNA 2'-O-methyltransferase n=1 Tax=uncultured Methanobrevibacter sp. TaxID=253161 RepID=UPI0025EB3B6C|nr:fibrillarin-like rRNA/tRNA 2'-O-methyltransferase [uncultured Methanobrevibacter sp.]
MDVYKFDDEIATINSIPSKRVYGERLITDEKTEMEYRLWNPNRSKLASALLNGLSEINLKKDSKVLYLGASTGTTVSHISDIVENGIIYAVEFSPVSMRKLSRLSQTRNNIVALLNDATKPKEYLNIIEKVDLVYCDVAQASQTKLFIDNMNIFLKSDGQGVFMIKSRSINVNIKPKTVFKEQEKILKANGYKIIEKIKLEPYEKDHICFLVERSF